MDVNHYTRIGIVSPQEGFTQPEILQEAKQGVIDDSLRVDKQKVIGLLNGLLPSSKPQQEAYRLLLVGACNAYNTQMPFLFPKIDDYTELLMPDDLLSKNSILHAVRDTLTNEACLDVEVIGWLYQFYISERKDEVFATKKVIEAEDIPAVTQLFTPHYIVRYLVENSLGRLWMLNHPDSKLVERMDYYIQPKEPETNYLHISSPEEIRVCDPACGSGHMLTYAFDLLYAIYEEQGYDPLQIPSLILQNNLYGIEIDQRAGHLAAFAMMMKTRMKDRRFFNRGIEPNICVLENIIFTPEEISNYKNAVGPDLFTQELWFLLQQFEQAENFGSLIRPQVKNPLQIREHLQALGVFDDMFLRITSEKVKRVLQFAEYLSPRHHVVIANPPYLKPSNLDLKKFAKDQYPDSKTDLGVMFIERNLDLVIPNGFIGMITLQSWMFLASFERFRRKLINNKPIVSMAQLGARAFDSISGEVVSTTATIINNISSKNSKGTYFRLVDGRGEEVKKTHLREAIENPDCGWRFYISNSILSMFESNHSLNKYFYSDGANKTGNNSKYLRYHWEVETKNIITNKDKNRKWFLCAKGGEFRRWYGNIIHVIDWLPSTREHYRKDKVARLLNKRNWYINGITWSRITSGENIGFRLLPSNSTFETAGTTVFPIDKDFNSLIEGLCLLSSKSMKSIYMILNPTLVFQVGDVLNIPFVRRDSSRLIEIGENAIRLSKEDWDAYEISFDFERIKLIDYSNEKLRVAYNSLSTKWEEMIMDMRELEEKNNQFFIDAYDLKEELTPLAKIEEITITCNPYYRYSNKKDEVALEALRLTDTMKELISYAVGCMLGRYSLDKEGLILTNTGETLEDYLRQVPEPTFPPDEDNVIPVLEGEWFEDDIAERLKNFFKVTFGEENFEENLAFLEEAIGRNIRSYFVKDFYNEHVKMYKKRPIYWLFSSPNGSFNALIYMHRYRPDTPSVILNDYLVPYRDKLKAHKALLETRVISPDASQGEKTRASREIDQIHKILSELKEYEDEILYPLATQQVEIDLDDGVKINYNKFGKALQKVTGLSEN